jgi:hypothetical protein
MRSSCKRKKGGVRLSSDFVKTSGDDRKSAIIFFLNNSTFSILTNDSISCITLIAKLNDNIKTPFKSMRSNNIQLEVKSILLKIFLVHPTITSIPHNQITKTGWFDIPGREYNGIEVTSIENFDYEIETQIQIYQKSFISESSLLDAICPAIIYYDKEISNSDLLYMNNLQGLSVDGQDQLNKIINGVNVIKGTQISIIYMELMEGFQTAYKYFWEKNLYLEDPLSSENYRINPTNEYEAYLLFIIQYEFQRLNRLGYFHGDAHLKNVMINVDYNYFLLKPNNNFSGRAIIIDFGRTKILSQEDILKAQKGDESIYNKERYTNLIPSSFFLKQEYYNLLSEARIDYINRISGPIILQNFNVTNMNLQQFVLQILHLNQYNLQKIGGDKNNLIHKSSISYINNLNNNKNKSSFNQMNLNTIFEKFKIELEQQNQMDPSYLFSLEPISEQINKINSVEFETIIQKNYFNEGFLLKKGGSQKYNLSKKKKKLKTIKKKKTKKNNKKNYKNKN